MKKIIVVLAMLLFSQLFAQSKSVQVGVGVNQSWFIFDESFLNDYKPDFRPKMSVYFNYNFAEFCNFTVSAGLRYYNLGRALTLDFGNSREETVKTEHYLISFPVQLKYGLEFINTNLILNAETSYILASTTRYLSSTTGLISERTITDEMNRMQFSVGLGAEYIFIIGGETFGVKTIYNYGLTKIPPKGDFRLPEGTVINYILYRATELDLSLSYYF